MKYILVYKLDDGFLFKVNEFILHPSLENRKFICQGITQEIIDKVYDVWNHGNDIRTAYYDGCEDIKKATWKWGIGDTHYNRVLIEKNNKVYISPVVEDKNNKSIKQSYTSYNEYLKSDKWQQKRDNVLTKFKNRCQICNGTFKLNVHHRIYNKWGTEKEIDLVVLCFYCHELFHQNGRLHQ